MINRLASRKAYEPTKREEKANKIISLSINNQVPSIKTILSTAISQNLNKEVSSPSFEVDLLEFQKRSLSSQIGLTVKTLTGNIFPLTMSPSDSIEDIKIELFELTGLSICKQRLVFKGELIKDDSRTLSDIKIQNRAIIHLVPNFRPEKRFLDFRVKDLREGGELSDKLYKVDTEENFDDLFAEIATDYGLETDSIALKGGDYIFKLSEKRGEKLLSMRDFKVIELLTENPNPGIQSNPLLSLVEEQNVDGFWSFSPEFWVLISSELGLVDEGTNSSQPGGGGNARDLWLTRIVVGILESKFPEENGRLNYIIKKAKSWLQMVPNASKI